MIKIKLPNKTKTKTKTKTKKKMVIVPKKKQGKISPAPKKGKVMCTSHQCPEKRSNYHCLKCNLYYCKKCKDQPQILFQKTKPKQHNHKKHKKYVKEIKHLIDKRNKKAKCIKHNQKYKFYCSNEDKLLCQKCTKGCILNNHTFFSLKEAVDKFNKKVAQILTQKVEEDLENQKSIYKIKKKKNKLRLRFKDAINTINIYSHLLKKKIEKVNNNHINLLKKYEINALNKLEEIIKKKKKKKMMIKVVQNKIKIIKEFNHQNRIIELIKRSKKLINDQELERNRKKNETKNKIKEEEEGGVGVKEEGRVKEEGGGGRKREITDVDEEEKEKESEEGREKVEEEDKKEKRRSRRKKRSNSKIQKKLLQQSNTEIFDLNNKSEHIILKNDNKTALNNHHFLYLSVCGKNKYSSGRNQIKIKINRFKRNDHKDNYIKLGIIDSKKKKNYISNGNLNGTYFFQTYWNSVKKQSESGIIRWVNENKNEEKIVNRHIQEKDIFLINIDMEKRRISFQINNEDLGFSWKILPELNIKKVNLFVTFGGQEDYKNKISII
ncbi:hypothetical protein M0813_22211 [Anaeramoeba flamelloides]|uniref:B box-type domain-containing protein n=1 Tax=Anaeramoeba flamelloides TaxID=1746091 RepID=A0ABQ8YGP0_9EUKA|nr:hypothetical protein M0813_22211 [Anaeramoeba flamelloides]